VRASHERWDGTGYPDRLAGTDIPLGARIIAVCDAYAAMTADRPHRPARDPRAALREVMSNTGSQFDPTVVAALCVVLDGNDAPEAEHPARVPVDARTARRLVSASSWAAAER
jgi:HD-GYP domain-containing protein (c-di-GMP phosphodiesterase class II)